MTPSRTLRRVARRSPGAVPAACSGGVLSLALVLALGASGCQSLNPGPAKNTPARSQPSTGNAPQNAAKTDFHKEASHEQGFNVHVELARVFESQGNFEAAVAEYQKAVDIGAMKGSSYANARLGPAPRALAERRMAGAFDRLGRFAQAEVHYRKALDLAPKDPKVWNDIGYSYYLQSRHADAERALKTAASFDPNNPRIQTNLGMALAAAGKTDLALASLSRAGGPAVGRANLGFILAAQGKTAEAKRSYEAALALQPQLTPARRALEQLALETQRASATAVASAVVPAATRKPGVFPAPLPPLPSLSVQGVTPTAVHVSDRTPVPARRLDAQVALTSATLATPGLPPTPAPPIPTTLPGMPEAPARE